MWFTGRVSGAATVLVTDPSQVTGLAAEAGALDTGVRAVDVAAPPVTPAPEEPVAAEEPAVPDWSVAAEGAGESDAPAGEEAAEEGLVPAAPPSSWAPVPLVHAVSESAARTVVAAAATRRTREVLDMSMCPFGVRVAVVIG
jgi:hypothetical protein